MSASGDGHGQGSGGGGSATPPPASGGAGHGMPTGETGYVAPHGGHAAPSGPGGGSGMVIVQPPGWSGTCPLCGAKAGGDPHHHASPDDLLPKDWNVPERVHRELAQLSRMAQDGGAPTATIGAAQAMLLVLLADLPPDLGKPREKKAKGFWGWLGALFADSPPPPGPAGKAPDPAIVLADAFEDGIITRAVHEASKRLPLVRGTETKTGSSKGKAFVRFLIELADAIHAQPARLA